MNSLEAAVASAGAEADRANRAAIPELRPEGAHIPRVEDHDCESVASAHAQRAPSFHLYTREFIEIFIRKNETSHKFRKFLAFSEFF